MRHGYKFELRGANGKILNSVILPYYEPERLWKAGVESIRVTIYRFDSVTLRGSEVKYLWTLTRAER